MGDRITDRIGGIIGNTPMLRLGRISPPGGATILGKMECLNPGGSVKDRTALSMIDDARSSGRLEAGTTIVEATSGNTGIALAMLCAQLEHRLVLTMPETMSFERRALVARYGAEVVLTPGSEDMEGARRRADRIVAENRNCIQMKQFENPANPEVHRRTTGPEILQDTGGRVTAFVAGIGTGGTITGVGEVLRADLPDVKLVGVEPARSAVLSGRPRGVHLIEGIGAGFVPSILNRDLLDEVIAVEDQAAFDMSERLAREEAVLVGISSGANVVAAIEMARKLSRDEVVVTVLCDTGTRYFSVQEHFRRDQRPDQGALL